MYIQVLEYLQSLAVIGGKRWMEGDSPAQLLTDADLEVIKTVKSGQIKDDRALAKSLYGPNSSVDWRYRRRLSRLEERLASILLTCAISPTVGARRTTALNCLRDITVGQTLLRAAGPATARFHLLSALRGMDDPEMVWYAPPIHLALAFYQAVNRHPRQTRLELSRAREAVDEAISVFNLLELWVHLSIPLRMKADQARRGPVITKARALLARTARRGTSGVVAIAAARLATTLSQLEGDTKLGIRWLDRSRTALIAEGIFNVAAQREYLTQRAFVYNAAHNYTLGVEAARRVVEVSAVETPMWFNAQNVLLHMQLKKGEYSEALETGDWVVSRKSFNKLPAIIIARVRIAHLYAQLLTLDKTVTMRTINTHKRSPLDVLVLTVLLALLHKRATFAHDTMHSLVRHIDRNPALKKSRPLWLLSRLVKVYADNGQSLRLCRQQASFVRYETELSLHKTMPDEHTIISPLQIWKAISLRR